MKLEERTFGTPCINVNTATYNFFYQKKKKKTNSGSKSRRVCSFQNRGELFHFFRYAHFFNENIKLSPNNWITNAKFKRYSAVFRAQVMEKEQHTVHCKTAEILEFYTLQNSWMASDEWENKQQFNAEHVLKQHFSFNSRKGQSESF